MEKSLVEKKIDELNLSWYNSYYWKYQYNLSKDFILPYLRSLNFEPSGKSICEIGSAEGGVLFAFAEEGAKFCLATDIEQSRLTAGEIIAQSFGLPISFRLHNIISDDVPEDWKEVFDLVILRDVIEHLEKPEIALQNIYKLLKRNGLLYVTFPPYYSPFGGHQHQVQNLPSKIPFLHWLPKALLKVIIQNGRPADVKEVLRLKDIRLTISKFKRIIRSTNYEIVKTEYYLIRPVYKYKFGLKSIRLPVIPLLNEILATEASFILVKK